MSDAKTVSDKRIGDIILTCKNNHASKQAYECFDPPLTCREIELLATEVADARGCRLDDVAPRKHCDDYIRDYTQPLCLRWWLIVNRMPAVDGLVAAAAGVCPRLFADYGVKRKRRVRVTMASRFGDVGVAEDLDREDGYERRVYVEDLSNFGDAP